MSARSYSQSANTQQQAATLSGLHSDYVMFLLDECGSMSDSVMASAEAALSSCIEGHVVIAGNPTHREGPLWRAATSERSLWQVFEVNGDPDNPKRAARVSITWAREQIQKYGRDNPFVMVNVLGKFPPSSLNALIGPDECRDAMAREYRPEDYSDAAMVLGCDVGRQGLDPSCVFPRRGIMAFEPLILRNVSGTEGAGLVARKIIDWNVDATFIDDTGGYGGSWIDNLIRLGHSPIGVQFAGKASDPRYANKRSEILMECVEWVKRGGRLPPACPELIEEMCAVSYTFQGDKFLIEPKDSIRARIGRSTDRFDALGLTFASPVVRKGYGVSGSARFESHHDPFAAAWSVGSASPQPRTWSGIGGLR
jgi:phage terminase large subunit